MFVHPKEGSGWLLLCHAVHRAQAPDEISRIDGDDLPRREEFGESIEGDAIVCAIENWGEYDSVGNVEIRIARWQTAAFEHHRLGHGKFDYRQLACRPGRGLIAASAGSLEGRMIQIFAVRLDHGDDRVLGDETRQVVYVSMGVVAEDAASQPDGVRRTQIIGESFFVVNAAHVRIALLHFAEQAFLRGQNRSRAVDVDGSAFEHDPFFV